MIQLVQATEESEVCKRPSGVFHVLAFMAPLNTRGFRILDLQESNLRKTFPHRRENIRSFPCLTTLYPPKKKKLHHGATNSAISRLKKRWSTLLRSSSLESWRNWMKKSFRCACFQLAFPYEKVHLYHVIPSFGILSSFWMDQLRVMEDSNAYSGSGVGPT